MNNNFKMAVILGCIVLLLFLFFLYFKKTSQYDNPESLQKVDETIFNVGNGE